MQKIIKFYHDKGIYMLKLGCTLPNLVSICLHKSTDYNFYLFFSSEGDLLEKYGKMWLVGPQLFSHGKQLQMKPLFENQKFV